MKWHARIQRPTRWIRMSALPILASLVSGMADFASAQPARALIRTLPQEQVPAGVLDELEDRTAAVIQTSELRRNLPANASREFLVDLGTGRVFTAVLKQRSSGGGRFGWNGILEGLTNSSIVFVVRNQSVFGTIQRGDTIYYISQLQGNIHAIHRELQSELPPELPPEPDVSEMDAEAEAGDVASTPLEECPPRTVDVLVVYTPRARDEALTDLIKRPIGERVEAAVEETNVALAQSGVQNRINLVGAIEVDYLESGDLYTDRDRLRNNSDGHLDRVHQWRAQHGADVVSLWIGGLPGGCGVAYILREPQNSGRDSAFHVVPLRCALTQHSFAHELGHNLGLAHNRHTKHGPGAELWSYGHLDPAGAFRTIMAYPKDCVTATTECPRERYFSNPQVFIDGKRTGVDHAVDPDNSAMNAMTLRKTMCYVSGWNP